MKENADFSCHYPQQLYAYCLHTRDKKTLEELYPVSFSIEEWFVQYAEGLCVIKGLNLRKLYKKILFAK
jgi:hypothetical protein